MGKDKEMQQVSMTAPAAIQNTLQSNTASEKTTTDKIKEKWEEIPDGDKQIAAGLSALAAVAIAAIAIMKGKKPAETQEVIQNGLEEVAEQTIKKGSSVVTNAIDNSKNIQNTANQVKEAVADGANYGKIRRETLKNKSHNDKKVIKEALHQGVSERNAKQQQVLQQKIGLSQGTQNSLKAAEKANQGVGSALSKEELDARKLAANNAAAQARKNADELKQTASTHKETKYAQKAHNEAEQARLKAKTVEQNADKRMQELQDAAAKKEQNIKKLQESPNYEAGLEKQAKNAEVTNKNAQKRLAKKEREKIERKFAGSSQAKLLALADSKKITPEEREVILDMLNKGARNLK